MYQQYAAVVKIFLLFLMKLNKSLKLCIKIQFKNVIPDLWPLLLYYFQGGIFFGFRGKNHTILIGELGQTRALKSDFKQKMVHIFWPSMYFSLFLIQCLCTQVVMVTDFEPLKPPWVRICVSEFGFFLFHMRKLSSWFTKGWWFCSGANLCLKTMYGGYPPEKLEIVIMT
jgi:hypothetical protein